MAACRMPCIAPALPAMLSSSMPIVIREGKPCGLNRMSGTRPDSEKGMSSAGHRRERTPFWPWREENLSPGMGLRLKRSLMKARWQGPECESPSTRRT